MSKILEKLLAERAEKKAKLKEKKRKENIKKNTERRTKKRNAIRKEKLKIKQQAMIEEKKAKEKEAEKLKSQKKHQEAIKRAKTKYEEKKKKERRAEADRKDRNLEKHILRRDKKIEELEAKDAIAQQINAEKRKERKRRRYAKTVYRTKKDLAFNEYVAEQAKEGNIYSDYWVIITRNCKKKHSLKRYKWSNDAFNAYNEAIEKNQKDVQFPQIIGVESNEKGGMDKVKLEYEILILEYIDDDERVSAFKNEDGKFENNLVIDDEHYKIIAKHEWLIEDTFHVYGCNPLKDRKTFSFIKDEMIMNGLSSETMKRIFTYNNKLIIQKDSDIDIVVCKSSDEAIRLYGALQKKIGDNKYIFFSGVCQPGLSNWISNLIKEKTGWSN